MIHYLFYTQLYYDILHADRFVYYIFLDNHTVHFEGLKLCLLDLLTSLKKTTSFLRQNDNTGIKTRILLIDNDKPMFLKLYNSQNLLTGNCNWTYRVKEIVPYVEDIEKEFSTIINNFTTPTNRRARPAW